MAVQGTDLVSYFRDGGPVKGRAGFQHDFDGVRYLFSTVQNGAAVVADPDRYAEERS